MGLAGKVLRTAGGKMKPVLKKVLPIKVSRALKQKTIDAGMASLIREGREHFNRQAYPDGINEIGLFKAQMGLGQGARLLGDALKECSFPVSFHNFVLPNNVMHEEDTEFDKDLSEEYAYNINVIHVNPEELSYLYLEGDRSVWNKRYNIGFWLWELENLPQSWLKYFSMLDEIWTPSKYITENIQAVTDLPVKTIPYPVGAPYDERYDRNHFHLPSDRFLFLVMYDSNSTIERKNPLGAIRAYKAAFKDDTKNTGLVIKINNPTKKDLTILKKEVAGIRNVYFITNTMDKTEVNSLIRCADVFVSLHRAEGFGLVMAEAMLLGTPSIATNYSSNTEFMNRQSSCMVDYKYTMVKKEAFPYKRGERWAEPNLRTAAIYMRKLATDKEAYQKKREAGIERGRELFNTDRIVKMIEERVKEIYEENK